MNQKPERDLNELLEINVSKLSRGVLQNRMNSCTLFADRVYYALVQFAEHYC